MRANKQGFTLVELSIVLVILGLLVGGVLSGQSLIRAAELRSVTSEKDKYTTALYAFRDKYFGLPGDLANGFAFFGTACGDDSTTVNVGCNGNGDGIVQGGSSIEYVLVWEHLSRAGLVEGAYDGTGTLVSGEVAVSTSNLPPSKLSPGVWSMSASPCEGCNGLDFSNSLLLALGSIRTGTGDPYFIYPHTSLTLQEAWNIDKKVDDGWSMRGKLHGYNAGGALNGCMDNTNDPYGIAFLGPEVANECNLVFKLH